MSETQRGVTRLGRIPFGADLHERIDKLEAALTRMAEQLAELSAKVEANDKRPIEP